jgi:hypothetical protein
MWAVMSNHPGKVALAAVIGTAFVAATVGSAVTSHAGVFAQEFQSPSGNVSCSLTYYPPMASRLLGANFVQCDIGSHSWVAPRPAPNDGKYTGTFVLVRGRMPVFGYRQGAFAGSGAALENGQTRSAGAIACTSEQSAMTCTDVGTGHFFWVSEAAYELG